MSGFMKRTSVLLPDDLYEMLRLESLRAGINMAGLIRENLSGACPRGPVARGRTAPILKVAGVCRGPKLTRDIDESLYGD
jgi:hypothetical protein